MNVGRHKLFEYQQCRYELKIMQINSEHITNIVFGCSLFCSVIGLGDFRSSVSRHQIVTTSRLFTTIKSQNLFEVQAYFLVLNHCHDQTGKNE